MISIFCVIKVTNVFSDLPLLGQCQKVIDIVLLL